MPLRILLKSKPARLLLVALSLVRVLQMHQFLSERERREGRQQQR